MSYQEFLREIQKKGSKAHKISHCYGARDAWKWVRKNNWKSLGNNKCESSLYGAVISRVNQLLAEKVLEGHTLELPHQMGTFVLAAAPSAVSFEEGKMKDNYRVDWQKTLAYWYEDEEAKKSKSLIKRVQKYIYFIRYSKHKARYRNQKYYDFRINRSLVRALGKKADNEKLKVLIY